MKFPVALALVAGSLLAGGGAPAQSPGGPLKFPRADPAIALFRITKSENRNRVLYAIRVGPDCAPIGARPVYAEWEMVELGPGKTEGLLDREQGLYGIGAQRVQPNAKGGGTVTFSVRGLSERRIDVTTFANGRCDAVATTRIDGAPGRLEGIFLELGWPFGVEAIRISGQRMPNGGAVVERVVP